MMEDSIQSAIHTVRLESLLSAFWIAKNAKFLHVDNEDSNQARMVRFLKLQPI